MWHITVFVLALELDSACHLLLKGGVNNAVVAVFSLRTLLMRINVFFNLLLDSVGIVLVVHFGSVCLLGDLSTDHNVVIYWSMLNYTFRPLMLFKVFTEEEGRVGLDLSIEL